MRQTLRFIIASIAVIFASFPLSTRAEVATTQMMLTDKHIEGFILVQKDIVMHVPFRNVVQGLQEVMAGRIDYDCVSLPLAFGFCGSRPIAGLPYCARINGATPVSSHAR